jgi:hypothetical protein
MIIPGEAVKTGFSLLDFELCQSCKIQMQTG